jgi:hypothetical protein
LSLTTSKPPSAALNIRLFTHVFIIIINNILPIPLPLKRRNQTKHKVSPLLGNTNDTASRAGASVASLLALLVLALSKVIGAGVDDNSAAKNALGADQLDELVRDGALGVALGVGLEVAQVADVALAVGGGAVGLVVGVDWRRVC